MVHLNPIMMPENKIKTFLRGNRNTITTVILCLACIDILYHVSIAFVPDVYAAIEVFFNSFAFPTFEGTTGSDFVLNLFKI